MPRRWTGAEPLKRCVLHATLATEEPPRGSSVFLLLIAHFPSNATNKGIFFGELLVYGERWPRFILAFGLPTCLLSLIVAYFLA